MRWIQKVSLKFRAALQRSRVEREMEAELAGSTEANKSLEAVGTGA